MNLIQAIKFARKYSSCMDETVDLLVTLQQSVKDGKIVRTEQSACMSKFWKLVKAIERVG